MRAVFNPLFVRMILDGKAGTIFTTFNVRCTRCGVLVRERSAGHVGGYVGESDSGSPALRCHIAVFSAKR